MIKIVNTQHNDVPFQVLHSSIYYSKLNIILIKIKKSNKM